MGSVKARTQPVQGQFKQGPVLCMDIDGVAAPTGSTARFDVEDPHTHKGFVTFDVGEFPLFVHPALPGWFTELEQAFAHCTWVSDWGSECILFAQGAELARAALWPHLEAPMDLTPDAPLTWHKLDGVRRGVHPEVPVVNAKVKFPTCAKVKFPSLWVVASHCDLLNFTPLRMLSVWFQPAEVAEVITLERLFMLHELHAQGASISAIAQQTGLDRKTVRRHLAAGIQPPTYGPRASRGSLIDAYTEYLQARIAHYPGLSAQRLLREIQAQGYTGGYATLTAYLHTIRPPKESGYEVRFETPAGHQAQVDFAHFKVRFRYDPQVVRVVWLFSLVLGHSRYLFGRFVWRQTLDVVVAAHAAAFAELGGVPAQILYDRMKTVVLDEPEPGEIIYHPTLLALAAHYGFRPRACRPYRAKTKGKVERPFRYVRQELLPGRPV